MKRSIYALTVATSLTMASIVPNVTVNASTLSDLQNKKNQILKEKSGVNSDLNAVDQQIDNLESKQAALESEKRRIDFAITDTNNKINSKTQEISMKQDEVAKLEVEIKKTLERIEKRNEMLKERARALQENGGNANYLAVLMGAQSFGDFIERLGAIATIMEADQDILKQHKADKQQLEVDEAKVKADLVNLEQMKRDLQGLIESLNKQSAEKDKLMQQLQKEKNQVKELKFSLEEEAQILAEQQVAIQRAIKLEQERLASLANPSKGTGGAGPSISSGYWTRPAEGVITSYMGPRWGTMHYGVDIAKRGTVPIVAAADGVVSRATYSSSYGNHVMITHYYNGQVYTTVYAHMSSLVVSAGAVVKKGQQIGYMGSTGDSTGQHLHLELHIGPYKWGPNGNAVNPLKYIPI